MDDNLMGVREMKSTYKDNFKQIETLREDMDHAAFEFQPIRYTETQRKSAEGKDSLKKARKESKLIGLALEDASVFRLTDDEIARMKSIRGRELSHLLLNNNRYRKDSDEMRRVKDTVAEVESMLNKPIELDPKLKLPEDPKNRTEALLRARARGFKPIETQYQNAIIACRDYLRKKKPSSEKGMERYYLVNETMNNLIEEVNDLSLAKQRIWRGDISEISEATTVKEILLMGRDYMKQHPMVTEEERESFYDSDKTSRSSYSDGNGLITPAGWDDIRSNEDDEFISFIDTIMLNKLPDAIIKQHKKKDRKKAIHSLNQCKKMMENFREGKFCTGTICVGNHVVTVFQMEDNSLEISWIESEGRKEPKERRAHLPTNALGIVAAMDKNIVENEDVFGEQFISDIMSRIEIANEDTPRQKLLANATLATTFLCKRLGVNNTDLTNIPLETRISVVKSVMSKDFSEADAIKFIKEYEFGNEDDKRKKKRILDQKQSELKAKMQQLENEAKKEGYRGIDELSMANDLRDEEERQQRKRNLNKKIPKEIREAEARIRRKEEQLVLRRNAIEAKLDAFQVKDMLIGKYIKARRKEYEDQVELLWSQYKNAIKELNDRLPDTEENQEDRQIELKDLKERLDESLEEERSDYDTWVDQMLTPPKENELGRNDDDDKNSVRARRRRRKDYEAVADFFRSRYEEEVEALNERLPDTKENQEARRIELEDIKKRLDEERSVYNGWLTQRPEFSEAKVMREVEDGLAEEYNRDIAELEKEKAYIDEWKEEFIKKRNQFKGTILDGFIDVSQEEENLQQEELWGKAPGFAEWMAERVIKEDDAANKKLKEKKSIDFPEGVAEYEKTLEDKENGIRNNRNAQLEKAYQKYIGLEQAIEDGLQSVNDRIANLEKRKGEQEAVYKRELEELYKQREKEIEDAEQTYSQSISQANHDHQVAIEEISRNREPEEREYYIGEQDEILKTTIRRLENQRDLKLAKMDKEVKSKLEMSETDEAFYNSQLGDSYRKKREYEGELAKTREARTNEIREIRFQFVSQQDDLDSFKKDFKEWKIYYLNNFSKIRDGFVVLDAENKQRELTGKALNFEDWKRSMEEKKNRQEEEKKEAAAKRERHKKIVEEYLDVEADMEQLENDGISTLTVERVNGQDTIDLLAHRQAKEQDGSLKDMVIFEEEMKKESDEIDYTNSKKIVEEKQNTEKITENRIIELNKDKRMKEEALKQLQMQIEELKARKKELENKSESLPDAEKKKQEKTDSVKELKQIEDLIRECGNIKGDTEYEISKINYQISLEEKDIQDIRYQIKKHQNQISNIEKRREQEEEKRIQKDKEKKQAIEEGREWDTYEEQLKNMMAELIYPEETWELDTEQNPGERIWNVFVKNADLLKVLILNKDAFEKIVEGFAKKLPIGIAGISVKEFVSTISNYGEIVRNMLDEQYKRYYELAVERDANRKAERENLKNELGITAKLEARKAEHERIQRDRDAQNEIDKREDEQEKSDEKAKEEAELASKKEAEYKNYEKDIEDSQVENPMYELEKTEEMLKRIEANATLKSVTSTFGGFSSMFSFFGSNSDESETQKKAEERKEKRKKRHEIEDEEDEKRRKKEAQEDAEWNQELEKSLEADETSQQDDIFLTKPESVVKNGMVSMLFSEKMNGSEKQEIIRQLGEKEQDLVQLINKQLRQTKKYFKKFIDEKYGSEKKAEEIEDVPFYGEKNIESWERQKRQEKGAEQLKKIMDNAMTGDQGEAQFIRNVLSKYLVKSSTLDLRSMLASAIRGAKPSQVSKDATDEEKLAAVSSYMGGLFKGAGPLLQKMLQGMPTDIIKGLESSFDDLKQDLSPIPPKIVEAELLSMVENSNGNIKKIEILKSLGAASVGQAFLCRVYKNAKELPKDVVIKLLRPDVRNRMLREAKIMKQCAAEAGDGMLRTYEGLLERYLEELDLTIEAENTEKGAVYNSKEHVSSMKVSRLAAPTPNAMMVDEAKGKTVVTILKQSRELRDEELKEFYTYDENKQLVMEGDHPKLVIPEYADLEGKRANIINHLKTMRKQQKLLCTMAENWVDEAIFGKGFYHGDLHAGNILVSNSDLTIIDFGNATKLDKFQQDKITLMIVAAAAGEGSGFMEGFTALLSGASKELLKSKKGELEAEFKKVMHLGSYKNTAERISAALITAQKMGFELPNSIYSFEQCQIRIQNTISDFNKEIAALEDVLNTLNRHQRKTMLNTKTAMQKTNSTHSGLQILTNTALTVLPQDPELLLPLLRDRSQEGHKQLMNMFSVFDCVDTFCTLSDDELVVQGYMEKGFSERLRFAYADVVLPEEEGKALFEEDDQEFISSYDANFQKQCDELCSGLTEEQQKEKRRELVEKFNKKKAERIDRIRAAKEKVSSYNVIGKLKELWEAQENSEVSNEQLEKLENETIEVMKNAVNAYRKLKPEKLKQKEKATSVEKYNDSLEDRHKRVKEFEKIPKEESSEEYIERYKTKEDVINLSFNKERILSEARSNLADPKNAEKIEKELAVAFEDKRYGSKLKETFEKYRNALEENADNIEVKEKLLEEFLQVYAVHVALSLFDGVSSARHHAVLYDETPDDFLAIMSKILSEKWKIALVRLNPLKTWSYGNLINEDMMGESLSLKQRILLLFGKGV